MNDKLIDLVAHNYSKGHDKIYMACIRVEFPLTGPAKYTVIGKWGRRGQTLKSQVKWTGNDRMAAKSTQQGLFLSKVKEGYINIDSPSYGGGVTRQEKYIAESMECLDEASEKAAPAKPSLEELEKRVFNQIDRVLGDGDAIVCINNAGIEDKFDLGVDYIFENHPDAQMIYVYDKNGVKGEFFRDRFNRA